MFEFSKKLLLPKAFYKSFSISFVHTIASFMR